MKKLAIVVSLLGLFSAPCIFAAESVKLENVHLCCKACVRGAEGACADLADVTAVADQEAGTVVITAPDKKTLRKGVTAVLQAGFYGNSSDSSIKVRDISKSEDEQVKSLTITGVHLCCNGCVDAVVEALETVKGVTGNTAERKVESFKVEGEFNSKEVFAALNKAGFSGRIGK